MKAKVYSLREKGAPLLSGQLKPVEGDIFLGESSPALGLIASLTGPKGERILPNLIQTKITGFNSDGSTGISGLEADPNVPQGMGPLYLQQWRVYFLSGSGVAVEPVIEVEACEQS